jgi:Holliday junction resolvase RusA-like endonuclease
MSPYLKKLKSQSGGSMEEKNDFTWIIEGNVKIMSKARPRTVGLEKPYRSKATGKMVYTNTFIPKESKACEQELKIIYANFMKDKKMILKDVPLKVSICIWLKRSFRQNKSDIDNLYKTITDSGNKIIYKDDKQIVAWGESRIVFGAKEEKFLLKVEPCQI